MPSWRVGGVLKVLNSASGGDSIKSCKVDGRTQGNEEKHVSAVGIHVVEVSVKHVVAISKRFFVPTGVFEKIGYGAREVGANGLNFRKGVGRSL